MKVIYLKSKGINGIDVKETELPRPNANEILVRVNAVALNYRDLLIIKNGWVINPKIPFAASSAGVGIVAEAGKDVSLWKKGDRVTTHFFERGEVPGGQSLFITEYVVIPEKAAAPVPAALTDEAVVSLSISGLAAWIALKEKADVHTGGIILLQGTGSVSLQALQLSKSLGATVIVLTGAPNKIGKLKSLGADYIINYNEVPQWYQQVKDITNGAGADLVLDVAGSATMRQSIHAVKEGGTVAVIGQLSGSEVSIDLMDLTMKGIRLQGIFYTGDIIHSGINQLYDFVAMHHIKPVIDEVFGFDQIKEALNYLDSGHSFGKILIKL